MLFAAKLKIEKTSSPSTAQGSAGMQDAAIIGSHGTYRLQLGNPGFLPPQIMGVVGMIAILEFEACLGVGIASRILWGIWSS